MAHADAPQTQQSPKHNLPDGGPLHQARETTKRLESAIGKNDQGAFNNAMQEVDTYRKAHTQAQTNQYIAGITNQLERDGTLPAVALFEAKRDFNKADTNHDGTITSAEARQFGSSANGLERALMARAVNTDKSGNGLTRDALFKGMDQSQNKRDQQEAKKATQEAKGPLEHLYEKGRNGEPSLYDRMKDKEGNLRPGAINNELARGDLGAKDKETLEYLNKQRHFSQNYNPWSNDMNKSDLDQLAKDQSSMRHLFDKGTTGHSLYDRIRDKDGNVRSGAISTELGRADLNNADRQSLEYLQKQMTTYRSNNPLANDMTRAQVEKLAKDNYVADDKAAVKDPKDQTATDARGALKHLYEPGKDGRSLYDRLRDSEGNIASGSIDRELKRSDLSDADRKSLEFIKNQQGTNEKWNPWHADLDKSSLVQNQESVKHLFEKGRDGKSLYDRLRDRDGNIPTGKIQDELLKDSGDHHLSDADKSSLRFLDGNMATSRRVNPFRSADVTKAEAQDLAKDYGVKFGDSKALNHTAEMKHLFEKNKAGNSLYDRLKDNDGNIRGGAINHELQRVNLSQADRKSLEYLKEHQNFADKNLPGSDMSRDNLAQLSRDNGLSKEYLSGHGLKASERTASGETPASADVEKAITVLKGEGYGKSALRLLHLAGVEHPTNQQMHNLIKQLREANHNAKVLHTGKLPLSDAIRQNPDLAKLFSH